MVFSRAPEKSVTADSSEGVSFVALQHFTVDPTPENKTLAKHPVSNTCKQQHQNSSSCQ